MNKHLTAAGTDATTTIQQLKDAVASFRDERGWGKGHSPRNLAISIAVEAAELMEHFQWGEHKEQDRQAIIDELADVLHYCFDLADTMKIDVSTACHDKLEHVRKKYPVELFHPGHHDDETYRRIRHAYRAGNKP